MKGWQTGTSAKSWALRRQGKFKEADSVLIKGYHDGDAEACLSLFMLWYSGGAAELELDGDRNQLLHNAAFAGHPVAMALMQTQDNHDFSRDLILASGNDFALMEVGERSPDLLNRLLSSGDPEILYAMLDHELCPDAQLVRVHLAVYWNHPLAAYLAGSNAFHHLRWAATAKLDEERHRQCARLAEDVVWLKIAVAQENVDAYSLLCSLGFSGQTTRLPFSVSSLSENDAIGWLVLYMTAELRRRHFFSEFPDQGQEWCTLRVLEAARQILSGLCVHLDLRIFELYSYGKIWSRLPTADVRLKDAGQDLKELHPAAVYAQIHAACSGATLVFMGCLRLRRKRRDFPRDIVALLGRLLWDDRERHLVEWWWQTKAMNGL